MNGLDSQGIVTDVGTWGPPSIAIREAARGIEVAVPPPPVTVVVWAAGYGEMLASSQSTKVARDNLGEFVVELLKQPAVQQVTVDLR